MNTEVFVGKTWLLGVGPVKFLAVGNLLNI